MGISKRYNIAQAGEGKDGGNGVAGTSAAPLLPSGGVWDREALAQGASAGEGKPEGGKPEGKALSPAEVAKWSKIYRDMSEIEKRNGKLLPSQRAALEQAEKMLGQGVLFGVEKEGKPAAAYDQWAGKWDAKQGGSIESQHGLFDEKGEGGVGRFEMGKDQGTLFGAGRDETEQWGKVIDSWKEIDPRAPVKVMETPAVLKAVGVSDRPLTMTGDVVRKVSEGKHQLSVEDLKRLPEAISDPLMVFDSAQVPDAVVVLTEIKRQNNNVMAAIHLDRRTGREITNRIASVYDKQSPMAIQGWVKAGLLRYSDEQKTRAWFQSVRLQLPKEGTKAGNGKLVTKEDVVKGGGLFGAGRVDEGQLETYLNQYGIPEEKHEEARAALRGLLAEHPDGGGKPYDLFAWGEKQTLPGSGGTAGNGPGDGGGADVAATTTAALRDPGGPEARGLLKSKGRFSSIVPELVKPASREWDIRGAVLERPEDTFKLLQVLRSPYVESLKAIVVNERGVVQRSGVIAVGSLNESLAYPREVLRMLVRFNTETGGEGRLIFAHNHPSGDLRMDGGRQQGSDRE